MLKKLLIVFGILAVLVIVAFGMVVFEADSRIEEALKSHEPEFRQYVTMSVEDQNAYIEKNLSEIMKAFISKADEEDAKIFWENVQNDPDATAAGIELGRSFVASYILDAKSMKDVLTDEITAKLKVDEDALEPRASRYAEILDKYDTKK